MIARQYHSPRPKWVRLGDSLVGAVIVAGGIGGVASRRRLF